MNNSARTTWVGILLAMASLLVSPMSALSSEESQERKAVGEGHGHASPHGGIVKTTGDFHLELGFQPTYNGFQCPMHTDEGNTYDMPGECPICEMKLEPHETALLEVYVLSKNEKEAKTISAKEVIAQVKLEDGDQFHAVTLTPRPLKGETLDAASHFVGAADFLRNAKAFQAVIRAPIDRKMNRAIFDVKAEDFHTPDEHVQEGEHESEHEEEHEEESHDH